MKKQIKEALVSRLIEMGNKAIGNEAHPIIKQLIPILKKENPDVDFDSLASARVALKPEGYITSWHNILKYSGLSRIDFYLPGYTFDKQTKLGAEAPGYSPTWNRGYEHPTVGSTIFRRREQKLGTTYGEMGQIINEFLPTI